MDNLLQLAAKYLPELDNIPDGDSTMAEELMKILEAPKKKKEKKHGTQKKSKKSNDKSGNQKSTKKPSPTKKWYPQPKVQAIPIPAMIPAQFIRAPVRAKQKLNKPHPKKTGTVIGEVSQALDCFKKKRDKFLIYLQHLQSELTELHLPSMSSENMVSSTKRKVKKVRGPHRRRRGRLATAQILNVQPLLKKKKLLRKKRDLSLELDPLFHDDTLGHGFSGSSDYSFYSE